MLINSTKYEGYVAYTGGKLRSECPYPILSVEEQEWLRGWNQGKKEDEFFAQLDDYDEYVPEKIVFDLYPERNYK